MALGPYPEKSWSLSKHREFIECRRKYFFSTFEQWGGWELTAPESKQKAYRLKKLSSLHAFLGTLVHREIAGALRGSLLTLDESLSRIKKSLLKGFDESIKKGRFLGDGSKKCDHVFRKCTTRERNESGSVDACS